LVKVTPLAPTTSFAYLATFFAFSIVPLKSTIKPSISIGLRKYQSSA
jgi:hypothetical protein